MMDRAQAIKILLKAASDASFYNGGNKQVRLEAVDALNALDVSDYEITAALREAWAEEAEREHQ
jgi:hypothetical protein